MPTGMMPICSKDVMSGSISMAVLVRLSRPLVTRGLVRDLDKVQPDMATIPNQSKATTLAGTTAVTRPKVKKATLKTDANSAERCRLWMNALAMLQTMPVITKE